LLQADLQLSCGTYDLDQVDLFGLDLGRANRGGIDTACGERSDHKAIPRAKLANLASRLHLGPSGTDSSAFWSGTLEVTYALLKDSDVLGEVDRVLKHNGQDIR